MAAEEESQKYKVGKYILETKRVEIWNRWELGEGEGYGGGGGIIGGIGDGSGRRRTELEEVEFDSQDEEECEDMFAGVWTPETALRRRRRRRGVGKEFGGYAGVGLRR